MIEPLLELPVHLRERLIRVLETGQIGAPYAEVAVRNALDGTEAAPRVCDALTSLHQRGIDGSAVAFALDLAARTAAGIPRPDIVWSGPEVPGLHARDTRRVYEELVAGAQDLLWISAYTYYDGPKAFGTLAERMDQTLTLRTTLLLNIQRKRDDKTASDDLVRRFAERLWKDWPGDRSPDVFYDPRSLEPNAPGAVLHAKAIVADDEAVFVTSANLTEAAFDRNIEVGVLSRDRALAASLSKHFRVLIERELLLPLPAG